MGVVAPTHKAIHNLLDEIEAAASPVSALKKCSPGDPDTKYEGAWIENEDELASFLDREVRLLAGTAWLFAREELDAELDVLVIDEAGQMSLADALAVGTAARSLVLLGDPLQLAQVSQGVHPSGTGCSVLEHLLGDDATVPPDRGLFLERTRRMHPEVCRFVSEVIYDGRLLPLEGLERQRVEGIGAGIRHLAVEHDGNSQASPEEADAIAAEIELLVGREYTPADGLPRPLRHEEMMVVAPYRTGNAPAGDYAELLVQRASGGELAPNSQKSWDVLTSDGERLQIEARVVTDPRKRGERQLSVFRSWEFDAAVVVLFDDEFRVWRAARLPIERLSLGPPPAAATKP